jgi:hypothetical protein
VASRASASPTSRTAGSPAYLEALSTAIFYGSLDGDVLTVKGFISVR